MGNLVNQNGNQTRCEQDRIRYRDCQSWILKKKILEQGQLLENRFLKNAVSFCFLREKRHGRVENFGTGELLYCPKKVEKSKSAESF